ncbi:MAG: S-layer homology domain-containing protein [Megasphaera sp.]|jgi:hypothetical protein|nr:S-layer homology domain-containing protein [Megasphaera sp.]
MKTKVLTALVATLAIGTACVFAANPFVDVPSDSWAYRSVVELADAGIIQGVDGSYFQGERNITRYEAAEMTAKAMAHMDKASVEQWALISKLADEYADELSNLGVRVANLENRVGNVKLTGDARVRYRYMNDKTDAITDKEVKGSGKKNDNSWDYRVRIRAAAHVNDRTKVSYGLSTDSVSFGNNNTAATGKNDNGDVFTDRAKVNYNFGGKNWDLQIGRTEKYQIGNGYGYAYGDIFDGVQLTYKNDNVRAIAGYGKFKIGGNHKGTAYDLLGAKTGFGEIDGFFGNGSEIGVYYNDFSGKTAEYKNGVQSNTTTVNADDLWGAFTRIKLGQKWNLLVDYTNINLKSNLTYGNGNVADPNVLAAQLTYGNASVSKPGSWEIWIEYLNADPYAAIGSTNSWRFGQLDNLKSWGIGGTYVFAKNAKFNVFQSFASTNKQDTMNGVKQADPEEQTRAEFVFSF